MAVLDAALEFSDAQTQVASSAAVTQSTNVIDTRKNLTVNTWRTAINAELGGLVWNCNINTVINAVTIITAKLMSHSAATSIKSGTEIAEIVFPAAAAAGTKRSLKIPPGHIGVNRYVGVTYTVSGAACTTGAIDSWLSLDSEKYD
jgi:hypothetical protein